MGEFPLTLIIIGLLWYLADKYDSSRVIPTLAVLLAQLALTYESAYGLLLVSLAIIGAILFFTRRRFIPRSFWFFVAAAALSLPFAVFQGGSLLSIVQGVFEKALGGRPAVIIHPDAESVFSLQWPPAIPTSHFGALSIISIPQLLVGLFEIGPIIFFTPAITKWAWRKFQQGEWMMGVLAISAWVGFILSMFVSYNLSERDITRFTKHAILLWNLFFIIMLLQKEKVWSRWGRGLAVL